MSQSQGSQPPRNPPDQQKLMEDILKGRITVAQLAEIDKQRRLQAQAKPASPGVYRPQPVPAQGRIAVNRIQPDANPRGVPAPQRPPIGRTAPRRPTVPAPGYTSRSPGPSQVAPPQSKPRPQSAAGAPGQGRPPQGGKTASRSRTATPAPESASASSANSGRAPADKSAPAPSASISAQIHRLLISHRSARTAWILSEVLGPPLALRGENERSF